MTANGLPSCISPEASRASVFCHARATNSSPRDWRTSASAAAFESSFNCSADSLRLRTDQHRVFAVPGAGDLHLRIFADLVAREPDRGFAVQPLGEHDPALVAGERETRGRIRDRTRRSAAKAGATEGAQEERKRFNVFSSAGHGIELTPQR